MSAPRPILLLFAFMAVTVLANSSSFAEENHAVELALQALDSAKKAVSASMGLKAQHIEWARERGPWADCVHLYKDCEDRLRRIASGGRGRYGHNDVLTWLSGALTSHTTCVDGLREGNMSTMLASEEKVRVLLDKALAIRARSSLSTANVTHGVESSTYWNSTALNSELWDGSAERSDIVVAQDGTGNYKTINEALQALRDQQRGDKRTVVYVKSGVYNEYVEIDFTMRNVMFVGDGIDKTIVTGNRNVPDGSTTFGSATFGVSADGFWARDMTFENTAGPGKLQAVALRVNSDRSIFYRCSFKGYQDTLFVHSMRQYYRDCHIYGTIDFIFGNAAAVIQNCDIFVRKPMARQSNVITAQGRGNPNQNTGISVDRSRVRPTKDLAASGRGTFRSYLGRPWQKYSRTVFLKTDLDGIIHPEGWAKWEGDFAVDTLYYGEYMNTGEGASTYERVNWPGFHVMEGSEEVDPFTVEKFLQGQSWIPESGVPFWSGIESDAY